MILLHDTAWLCSALVTLLLPNCLVINLFPSHMENCLFDFPFLPWVVICNILEQLYLVEVVQLVRLEERASLL